MLCALCFSLMLLSANVCFAENCKLFDPDSGRSFDWHGPCLDGKAHGHGYSKEGKQSYFGEARNGLPDGSGTAIESGNFALGRFSQGKAVSYVLNPESRRALSSEDCILYNPNGTIFADWNGPCINKKAEGYGYARSSETYYFGNAGNGKPQGEGIVLSPGNVFIGHLNQGNRVTGELLVKSGESFRGSFLNGNPYEGATYDPNGNVIKSGKFMVRDGVVTTYRDESAETAIGGGIALIFIAATGALLVGGAAIAAVRTAPLRVLMVVVR